jgi:hypothetical protein
MYVCMYVSMDSRKWHHLHLHARSRVGTCMSVPSFSVCVHVLKKYGHTYVTMMIIYKMVEIVKHLLDVFKSVKHSLECVEKCETFILMSLAS